MLNATKIQSGLVVLSLMLVSTAASPVSEFEQWKLQQQQAYQQFKDERDREFTAFLKQHWREVELSKGIVRDQKPKPVLMPVAEPAEVEPQPLPRKKPEEKPVDTRPPAPSVPVVEPEAETETPVEPVAPAQKFQGIRTRVDYFGTRVTFYYDPAFKKSIPYRLDENAISNFWAGLSRADYDALLAQLDNHAADMRLNDWGYALLTHRLAQRIYPRDKNRQALFSWFVLAKAGFASRVAYEDHRVFLLLPTRQRLYEVTYFTLEGERYYAVSLDGGRLNPGRVYTYEGHYPGAAKKLDMDPAAITVEGGEAGKRELTFEYGGRNYSIDATYQKARIDFLDTYPQLDLELYFAASVGEVAESPLLQQLAEEMDTMSEQEAVNFLLRFVQTSFAYRTDEQQFGRENYLFAEETIFYPYSDCEDRSVLFAWLVKKLLGLEVLGLNYPGHVATAVYLNDAAAGDYVLYNGRRYSVADPTYINATVGMTMPEHRGGTPDIIHIR